MSEKKPPAHVFWVTTYISAALFGLAIGGIVPWWAVIVPWIVYGVMVFTFLSLVFLISFGAVALAILKEYLESKQHE